jgi:hypothetical protein
MVDSDHEKGNLENKTFDEEKSSRSIFGVVPYTGNDSGEKAMPNPVTLGRSPYVVAEHQRISLPVRRFFRFLCTQGYQLGFFHLLFQLYFDVYECAIKFKVRNYRVILSKILTKNGYRRVIRSSKQKTSLVLVPLASDDFKRRFVSLKPFFGPDGVCIYEVSHSDESEIQFSKSVVPFGTVFRSSPCLYVPCNDLFDALLEFCSSVNYIPYRVLRELSQDKIDDLRRRYNRHQFPDSFSIPK